MALWRNNFRRRYVFQGTSSLPHWHVVPKRPRKEPAMRPLTRLRSICFSTWIALLGAAGAWGQGIALDGAGPINRSMGGAATAAPIDATGGLLWNPASLTGLPTSEIAFGMEMLLPSERISSSIAPNAPRAGSSAHNRQRLDDRRAGRVPHSEHGLGPPLRGLALDVWVGHVWDGGLQRELPRQSHQPRLVPPPNGLGQVFADAQYFQIAPTSPMRSPSGFPSALRRRPRWLGSRPVLSTSSRP